MLFRGIAFKVGKLVEEVRIDDPHLFFVQIVIGCDANVKEKSSCVMQL